jgi:hypothetical protein
LSHLLVGAGAELAAVALVLRDAGDQAFHPLVAEGGDDEAVGLLHHQPDHRLDRGDLRRL